MKKNVKKVNENVDGTELIMAINDLEKERGIPKDILLESIENALVTAYKRNFDVVTDNVKITMDKETGEVHIYAEYEVVEDVEDDKSQISLENARAINPAYNIGDVVSKELAPKNFGRISAQTAKQVIVQRIREASRDVIYNEFSDKKGEIVSGIIQKVDKAIVILDLGKVEGIMPLKEQIPTEQYFVNKKVRACIASVEKSLKGGPQIIVSRANSDFVRKLFELEIPEIYEGVIEIKSISRDPGKRCKVAVYSPNENIDPVGSCVGQKGIRIQNIISELSGEKIDVIEWHEDPSIYIAEALLPAKVLAVDIKEEERFAQVIVPDDQLSLAIGKGGQNAKLAARLTGWKIDIKSESQFRELLQKANNSEEESNEKVEQAIEEKPENVSEIVLKQKVEEVIAEEKPKKTTKKSTKKEDKEVAEEKPKKVTKKATKKEDKEVVKEKPKKATKRTTKKKDEE